MELFKFSPKIISTIKITITIINKYPCGIFTLQKSSLSDEEKTALRSWLEERNLIIVTQLEHIPSKTKLLIGNIHVTWTLFKRPCLQTLQVC